MTDGTKPNSSEPERSLVVFFGTYDSSAHPRVQVLIDGFTTAGCEVIELNRSIDFDTASRVKTAKQPWRAPGLVWRIGRAWWRLRRDAQSLSDRLGDRTIDLVVVGYLGQFDVHLASRLFDAPVVLDYMVGMGATTSDRGSRSSVSQALAWVDKRATTAADIVVVDTPAQAAICPSPTTPVVVPVGAPDLWFHDTTGDDRDGLRVVFFGLYTPLQGAPYIGDAISELAGRDDIRFTMIGDGQDRSECERRAGSAASRVEWIDWLSRDELAAEVARHDVCLGIFGTTPKADRVVPNKVYQGAAAGCAIVTSDTPPQRAVLQDAAILCPAGDGGAIAGALARLADDPAALAEKRTAARTLAETFRPHEIVAPLLDRMEDGRTLSLPPLPPLAPSARLRWDVVEGRLTDLPPDPRILELGAGSGAAAVRLALLGDYVGVEPDDESNRTARSRLPTGATLFSTIDDVEDYDFDLVCAFEVLEHLEDDEGELQRWVKHVKPGGMVVVSVPAHSHRFAEWDERVGHFRRYDPADLVTLLESAGLVDVTVQTYGFPISYLLERVRNIIAAREAKTAAGLQNADMATRTAGSGRLLQPPMWASRAIDLLTWPFRLTQRATQRTNLGTGVVGRGRVPS